MMIIKNCKLINMAGINEEIMDLLIENGKIRAITKSIDSKAYPQAGVIDAEERIVTPGLIEPHCHIGIYETAIGFPGYDGNERTNPVLPGLRALDAIHPMDIAYDIALEHGITTVVTGPGSANIIGGTFTAMKTYGDTMEECVIEGEIAIKMALGENPKKNYSKKGKMPSTRMGSAALMREALFKAREYYEKYKKHEAKKAKGEEYDEFKFDIGCHSLMRVFDGMRVKIHAHQADDIMTAIRIAEEFDLRYSIEHCSDGHLLVKEMKKNNVQCILGPTFGSKGKYESKNKTLQSAGILEKEGIEFAIMTDHPVIPIEGQLMQLALFVKHGLSREAALKAVTINAAKLNDIDSRVGSIEIGKDADIVIWNVDPLNTMSEAGIVIIDGVIRYEKKEAR